MVWGWSLEWHLQRQYSESRQNSTGDRLCSMFFNQSSLSNCLELPVLFEYQRPSIKAIHRRPRYHTTPQSASALLAPPTSHHEPSRKRITPKPGFGYQPEPSQRHTTLSIVITPTIGVD